MTPSQEFDMMASECKEHGYAIAAKKFGISRHAMMNRIKKVYPDFKTNAHIGGVKKYTDSQCSEILKMRDEGAKYSDIAAKFCATPSAIRQKINKLRSSAASS